MPTFPPGEDGWWGFFVVQLMGYVDGIPQHIGETYATTSRTSTGLFAEWGDWTKPGHMFSWRTPETDGQPAGPAWPT